MLTLDDFKEKYELIYKAVFDEGAKSVRDKRSRIDGDLQSIKNEQGHVNDSKASSIEDRAKAAWNESAELRFEFADNLNAYLAFVKAESRGRIENSGKGISQKSIENSKETIKSSPISDRIKADWDSDPALRLEFSNNFNNFAAFSQMNERGQVRIAAKTVKGANQ
ncbi:MAG: hypothetical protein U9Q84_00470 [Thermodesulfobacteriota bacterium]|nr:hypothetical protein [Thermodesulfobacteriota bacterium]